MKNKKTNLVKSKQLKSALKKANDAWASLNPANQEMLKDPFVAPKTDPKPKPIPKINKIICQYENCFKESRTNFGKCFHCHGYGHVLENVKICTKCEVRGWVRPGVFTSYDGKKWQTTDGIGVVDRENGRLCADCDRIEQVAEDLKKTTKARKWPHKKSTCRDKKCTICARVKKFDKNKKKVGASE